MATRAEHMARVEQEYGEPFLDVVRQYGADGESVRSTAAILEIPHGTFRSIVIDSGLINCFQSRVWSNAHKAAAEAKRGRKNNKTAESMKLINVKRFGFEHKNIIDTLAGHSYRHGIPHSTVRGRMLRGWALDDALSAKPMRPGGNYRNHPARKTA